VLKATKQMVQAASLSDGIRAKSVTKTEGESKIMNLSMTLFNSNNLYPFVYCFFVIAEGQHVTEICLLRTVYFLSILFRIL